MKIIGISRGQYDHHRGPEEFVCTVTRDELRQICGEEAVRTRQRFEIGDELAVGEIAERNRGTARIREQLESSARTLRACADLVDGAVDCVKPAKAGAP